MMIDELIYVYMGIKQHLESSDAISGRWICGVWSSPMPLLYTFVGWWWISSTHQFFLTCSTGFHWGEPRHGNHPKLDLVCFFPRRNLWRSSCHQFETLEHPPMDSTHGFFISFFPQLLVSLPGVSLFTIPVYLSNPIDIGLPRINPSHWTDQPASRTKSPEMTQTERKKNHETPFNDHSFTVFRVVNWT